MRKFYSYIVAAILMAGFIGAQSNVAVGQEKTATTYTMTIDGSSSNGSNNVHWTSTSQESLSYNNVSWSTSVSGTTSMTVSTTYVQIGSKNSPATQVTISTTAFAGKKITAASLTGYCMSNEGPALTVTAGSTTIINNVSLVKGTSTTYSTPNNLTPVVLGTTSNNTLTFTINSSAKAAIAISAISVTYVEPHTITFNGNGGTYNAATSYTQTVFDGEATNLTANQFTYADHNFLGWKDANDNDYSDGQSVSLTANLTLTAQWEAIGTDPYITASDVNVAYTATEGSISYTVNNFQSGTMTATTLSDWITIGTVTGPHATEHTGTVPFTMNANTGAQRSATVTLSYDYGGSEPATKQVTVTQAVAQYTVTYNKNDNGASGTMTDDDSPYNYNSTVTVLANGFTAPSGKAFDHWSTASDGGTTYDPDDTFNITGDVTLYAQWRTLHTYSLVTSTDQIVPGKHYIIANDTCGNKYAMGGVSSNNNYRERVAVEIYKTNGIIKIAETEGVYEFVISGKDNDDYWTIYDEAQASNHYLAATGNSSNNNMGVVSTAEDRSKWTIEIGADTTATIVAPLITGNDKRSHIRYNTASGQERFSCYKEGSTLPKVYLYVKDGDTNGTIYSATTLSKNESYNNLTIVKNTNVNGSITVPNNKTLTVTGTLTNNGTADNLVIEDGGQLITKNAVNATVQRHIDAYDPLADPTDGWYFIASPVSYDPDGTNLLDNVHDLFLYDEENVMWRNYENTGSGYDHFTMQPKQGYLYANSEDVDLSFAGLMPASNTANVTVDLNYSDGATKPGFNLVGNPFTCNVSGFKLKNKNTSEVSDLTTYYVVEGGTEIVTSTDPIKPGQGFMVEAGESNQQLVFNYAAAKGETVTKPAFVRIEAGNDAFMDRAFVQIGQGNTLRKMKLNENVAHVWLMQDGKDYAAASIAEACGEMPVNFRAAKDGEYTLTVNAENVEMNYLHLIDNLTGADVDLLATPSYTFNARTTDYASRFRLLFGASNEDGNEGNEPFAFVSNGQVVVNGTGTLQVIDMTGRIVLSRDGVHTVSTSEMAPGVYVLRLVNNGDVKTQKMVIE